MGIIFSSIIVVSILLLNILSVSSWVLFAVSVDCTFFLKLHVLVYLYSYHHCWNFLGGLTTGGVKETLALFGIICVFWKKGEVDWNNAGFGMNLSLGNI